MAADKDEDYAEEGEGGCQRAAEPCVNLRLLRLASATCCNYLHMSAAARVAAILLGCGRHISMIRYTPCLGGVGRRGSPGA